ncbi:MAG TPA: flagellar biosynthetic protein FliO [Burkholderiaceae bacterium]|nr:flagellar biosynthetic protein FliO [Burkholderiaceae bacterium]
MSAAAPGSMLTVLIVLAGCAAALPWALRRLRLVPTPKPGSLRVVQSVMVGQRQRIVVVEVAGKWVVAGVTPTNVNSLAVLDPPAPETSSVVIDGDAEGETSLSPTSTAATGPGATPASAFLAVLEKLKNARR